MLASYACIHRFSVRGFNFIVQGDYFLLEFYEVHPSWFWFFAQLGYEFDVVRPQMLHFISKINQEVVSTVLAFTIPSSNKPSLIFGISFVVILLFANIFSFLTFLFRICIFRMLGFRLSGYLFFFRDLRSWSLMNFSIFGVILSFLITLISAFEFR